MGGLLKIFTIRSKKQSVFAKMYVQFIFFLPHHMIQQKKFKLIKNSNNSKDRTKSKKGTIWTTGKILCMQRTEFEAILSAAASTLDKSGSGV